MTVAWRQRHVLAPARLKLTGSLVNLIDVPNRREIERREALLLEHGLEHVDLHEVTTSRRAITQTIAAELFECGAAAVGFRHDWTAMPAPRGVKAAASDSGGRRHPCQRSGAGGVAQRHGLLAARARTRSRTTRLIRQWLLIAVTVVGTRAACRGAI